MIFCAWLPLACLQHALPRIYARNDALRHTFVYHYRLLPALPALPDTVTYRAFRARGYCERRAPLPAATVTTLPHAHTARARVLLACRMAAMHTSPLRLRFRKTRAVAVARCCRRFAATQDTIPPHGFLLVCVRFTATPLSAAVCGSRAQFDRCHSLSQF